MKNLTIFRNLCALTILCCVFSRMNAGEVKIIDENIQSWKAIASYGDGEQVISVGNGEGAVVLNQVIVIKSKLPDNIDNAGVCSAGYIQMTTNRTPSSSVKLPTIPGGVSKIELSIVTSSSAARTVDVLIEENASFKTTLSGLNKTGSTYTVSIGSTGSTTLVISNVTGGPIYITDIRVYQNQTPVNPNSDASLASLSYDIGNGAVFVPDFSPDKMSYDIQLPSGTTVFPVVSAVPAQNDAVATVSPVTSLPGTATVLVNAPDHTISKTYQINFSVVSELFHVAVLPLYASATSADDPLQNLVGFSGSNLGTPSSDGGTKFEGSKASTDNKPSLILAYDSPADKISFDIKGNNAGSPLGFEGIQFVVEESADGDNYSQLIDLSDEISAGTKYKTYSDYGLKKESRYVRWRYLNAAKGNISLNNVVVTKQETSITFPDADQDQPQVFVKEGVIYVTTASAGVIELFDVTGQKLKTVSVEKGIHPIVPDGNRRFVILKVGTQTFKVVF